MENNNEEQFPDFNLNEREQLRYFKQFMELAGKSVEVAQAIQSGNNEEIMKTFLFFTFQMSSLDEFRKLITSTLEKNISNKKLDFPDIIYTDKKL